MRFSYAFALKMRLDACKFKSYSQASQPSRELLR